MIAQDSLRLSRLRSVALGLSSAFLCLILAGFLGSVQAQELDAARPPWWENFRATSHDQGMLAGRGSARGVDEDAAFQRAFLRAQSDFTRWLSRRIIDTTNAYLQTHERSGASRIDVASFADDLADEYVPDEEHVQSSAFVSSTGEVQAYVFLQRSWDGVPARLAGTIIERFSPEDGSNPERAEKLTEAILKSFGLSDGRLPSIPAATRDSADYVYIGTEPRNQLSKVARNLSLKVGLNRSRFQVRDQEGSGASRTGLVAGVSFLFGGRLAHEWELLFSQRGTAGVWQDPVSSEETDFTVRLTYISLIPSLRVALSKTSPVYFSVGPEFGLLLDANGMIGKDDVDLREGFKDDNFGLRFGVGMKMEAAFVQVGYFLGTSTLLVPEPSGNNVTVKARGGYLLMGWRR